MIQNSNYRNTTKHESIYGWYPSVQTESFKEDPKEIYTKLGTRPPKQQSYCGMLKH
jgi:hypothetical protein